MQRHERSLATVFGAAWKRVLHKTRRAVVYLDAHMAECLQWNGGLGQLFAAGAAAVRGFSADYSPKHEGAKKAMFILRGPLTGPCRDTLRVLVAQGGFEYCIVVTVASAALHRFLKTRGAPVQPGPADSSRRELNADVVEEMELGILQWTNNPNSTVEIMTQPLLGGARLVDDVAILTTCAGLPLSGDAARVLFRHVAATLVHVCAALCPAQPEVFYSPGPNADRMSKEFLAAAADEAVWPTAAERRKAAAAGDGSDASAGAALILVDRAADLGGPAGHWGGSVAECAFASRLFPHLAGHSSDLAVEIPKLGEGDFTAGTVFPGCLSDVLSEHPELVSSAILDPTDKCVGRLTEKVRSRSRADDEEDANDDDDFHDAEDDDFEWGESPSRGGDAVNKESDCSTVEGCVRLLSKSTKTASENCGLLQACLLATAAKAGVSSDSGSRTAAGDGRHLLSSLETALLQLCSTDDAGDVPVSETFLLEVERQLRDRRAVGVTLDDVLGLLTFAASLLGGLVAPVLGVGRLGGGGGSGDGGARERSGDGSGSSREGSPCDSSEIEPMLVDALWEDRDDLPPICAKIVGPNVNEMSVRIAGRKIAAKLAWVAAQRYSWAPKFRELVRCPEPGFPAEYSPLLGEVMKVVLGPAKAEVPGIFHRPAEEEGLRDMLKTRLGFLMKTKKTMHPADADIIVVAVLGGLSPFEIRTFRNLVDSKTDKRVVLCGTRLLKPGDTVEELFVSG